MASWWSGYSDASKPVENQHQTRSPVKRHLWSRLAYGRPGPPSLVYMEKSQEGHGKITRLKLLHGVHAHLRYVRLLLRAAFASAVRVLTSWAAAFESDAAGAS
jgi:hypothetical protein